MPGKISGGVVHTLPSDLKNTLTKAPKMLLAWENITPLARNEFICWIEGAKKAETRERRIRIAQDKLERGERRPCCFAGCSHRNK